MSLSARLAWTQTLSLWRSGALRVLVFSLVLAVTAISAIGFFTQRVETALNQQGGLLLGGDLAVIADHAIPDALLNRQHFKPLIAPRYNVLRIEIAQKLTRVHVRLQRSDFSSLNDQQIAEQIERTVKFVTLSCASRQPKRSSRP